MKPVMNKKKMNEFKEILTNWMNDLVHEARASMADMKEEKVNFADMSDQASAEIDQAFLHRIRGRERKLILKIREALDRIKDGTFGVCEVCGEPIGEERLKARAVTTQCIECKTDMEDQERRMEA